MYKMEKTAISKEQRKEKVRVIIEKVDRHYSVVKQFLASIRDACCNCEASRIIVASQRSDSTSSEQLMKNICEILEDIKTIDAILKGKCNIHTPLETLVSNQIFELTQLRNDCNETANNEESEFHQEEEKIPEPQTLTPRKQSSIIDSIPAKPDIEVLCPKKKFIEEIDISDEFDDDVKDINCHPCSVRIHSLDDSTIEMGLKNANEAEMKMKHLETRAPRFIKREKLSTQFHGSKIDNDIQDKEDLDSSENLKSLQTKADFKRNHKSSFKCSVCGKSFAFRIAAARHCQKKSIILKCSIDSCGKQFKTTKERKEHILGHIRNNKTKSRRRRNASGKDEEEAAVSPSEFVENIQTNQRGRSVLNKQRITSITSSENRKLIDDIESDDTDESELGHRSLTSVKRKGRPPSKKTPEVPLSSNKNGKEKEVLEIDSDDSECSNRSTLIENRRMAPLSRKNQITPSRSRSDGKSMESIDDNTEDSESDDQPVTTENQRRCLLSQKRRKTSPSLNRSCTEIESDESDEPVSSGRSGLTWNCKYCDKQFKSKYNHDIHEHNNHAKSLTKKSQINSFDFINDININKDKDKESFGCRNCGKYYESKSSLRAHNIHCRRKKSYFGTRNSHKIERRAFIPRKH